MHIANLSPTQLRLNPHNDRHGPLRDESASIQWLLENRSGHMRALALDLAAARRLYERPLVRPEGGQFIVFDGNRRCCCIKLLTNPALAPSDKWQQFFSDLADKKVMEAFSELACEVEIDLEVIDEVLLRRHTGSQDGVGQSPWDAEGKSFFMQRTGKASAGLGESIERALKAEGLIAEDAKLPWSNIERLFSSEPIRRRAGISFSGGELTYLTNKQKNLETLKRIADDMTGRGSKKVVLGDLWNNTKKGKYLDELKTDGVFIDAVAAAAPNSAAPIAVSSVVATPTHSGHRRAAKEKFLISSADKNPFMSIPELERAQNIWRELQFELQFDRHDNAIAVLMRVVLELAISYYANRQGVVFSASDYFARRVSAVADSMLNRGILDKKGREIIRKFESDKPIVSAHSMHQYVHNASFHPSRSDLKAIWIVVRVLVIGSVR